MLAVDTNVLVSAHRAEAELHEAASSALRDLAEGDVPWALPVFVVNEFVRVVTHPRVFTPPSSPHDALGVVAALLGSPTVRHLTPGRSYVRHLAAAIDDGGATGNLVHDAAIVALCREHGVDSILTNDRDLRRFDSIRVVSL
ncbi:MAG: TA system VapC family ribonuclease toxin [Actinomycetota bacterium]